VRKSGGDFRQTADYKPLNAFIEAIAGVMPDLHVDLEDVKGAKVFGLFDFLKGYWQIALAEESQEWLSYMTHRKVYTPRRVCRCCSVFPVDNSEVLGGAVTQASPGVDRRFVAIRRGRAYILGQARSIV
jgi:hypothetical protein